METIATKEDPYDEQLGQQFVMNDDDVIKCSAMLQRISNMVYLVYLYPTIVSDKATKHVNNHPDLRRQWWYQARSHALCQSDPHPHCHVQFA